MYLSVSHFFFSFALDHDDYNVILTKAVVDRLAEAFAEHLHERVRVHHWAYETRGKEVQDLHKLKYQVTRFFLFFLGTKNSEIFSES